MTPLPIGLLLLLVCASLVSCSSAGDAERFAKETPTSAVTGRWAIVIHGGAGSLDKNMPEPLKAEYNAALRASIDAGRAVLMKGGTSLDAAQAAVIVLEDHPLFNAGRGAVLTREGVCELDASIMDGRSLGCGAVTGVRTVKNPVTLARAVMTGTPHILLCGTGAEQFADTVSVAREEPGYFVTQRRRQQLDQKMKELGLPPAPPSPGLGSGAAKPGDAGADVASITRRSYGDTTGTVGCVALDVHGNIAAATSTGGLNAKMAGRIGDTPIIGAGTYANNLTLGVSCTGTGEQFMRHVAGHELSSLVRYGGLSLPEAASVVLNNRLDPDDGGLIAIGRDGTVVMLTTTGCMPRASADSSGRLEIGIWEECRVEK